VPGGLPLAGGGIHLGAIGIGGPEPRVCAEIAAAVAAAAAMAAAAASDDADAVEEVGRLAGLLNRSGMETRALADARGAQWTKLLFNASTNPLCGLTGLTHGQLCEYPPTRRLVGELIREGRAVADALGITLDADPDALVDAAARDNYDHRRRTFSPGAPPRSPRSTAGSSQPPASRAFRLRCTRRPST
jgi:Ketopantoate reductase PanE/ApbA C terminal